MAAAMATMTWRVSSRAVEVGEESCGVFSSRVLHCLGLPVCWEEEEVVPLKRLQKDIGKRERDLR
jgi:hypothetical protein